MERSAVIIGSGLGGLECGHILSRRGWKVTVLEQHSRIGGCMQSFRRGGTVFDTGLHFVGGEDLSPLAEFGLDALRWRRLEGEEVIFGGDRFFLPSQGHDAFVEALSGYFPSSRDAIVSYVRTLRDIAIHPELMERGAYEYLCETFRDPMLRNVVSGTALKMELDSGRLPLFVFGRISDDFVRGLWRLDGGGSQIAESLARDIRSFGGEVLTGARVVRLETGGSRSGAVTGCGLTAGLGSETERRTQTGSCARVSAVVTEDGRRFEAEVVISDIHPAALVAMTDGLRKVYARRIAALDNTGGMFTVNIRLRPEAAGLVEPRSIYVHAPGYDPWHPGFAGADRFFSGAQNDCDRHSEGEARRISPNLQTVGISFGCGTVDLMTPVGSSVISERTALARECIAFVSERLPWLEGGIDELYTSTPDTYRRYTLSPDGSAYGIVKDFRDTLRTSLSVRTPLENLYLTGQNIGIHGVLGVTKSAHRTCDEILRL